MELLTEKQTKKYLEEKYGAVYDTQELQKKFIIESFLAPIVFCTEKETGEQGTMEFTHMPRFYFNFKSRGIK